MGGGSTSSSTQSSDSMSMGVSQGSSASHGSSTTLESNISREQYDILSSRQEVFESDFLPNWQSAYKEIDKNVENARQEVKSAKDYGYNVVDSNLALLDKAIEEVTYNSPVMKANMALQSSQINNAYSAAQKQTAQNLAKQNLLGTGSGVSAALKAQNDRAKSGALAQAYYNSILQNDAQKQNLLGLRNNAATAAAGTNQALLDSALLVENAVSGQKTNMLNTLGTLMPKPTQDVAYHQHAENDSWGRQASINNASSKARGFSKSSGIQIG